MCGFTGWFDSASEDVDLCKKILQHMTRAIAHRGPDASGYYLQGPIALGHRRLAVLDLASSIQPMCSEDGRYVLAYNGELYNFRELRKELQALGCSFRTEGDTEVVLQALIVWGEGILSQMRGMFAFAFWDNQTESLLLARDHLGVKPLHYAYESGRLVFGSEIKSLLEHPKVSREINPLAIGLYLECQYIPTPHTIYQHIQKLPAAHLLRMTKEGMELECYWTPSYSPKFEYDEPTALDLFEKHLQSAVSSMMVSDVPIGAFVSGGIDSSLIAALMQKASDRPAKIFNLGFSNNSSHSEHEYAAAVAKHLQAEHYPLMISTQDAINALDQWVDIYDEPFGDSAALPTLLLARFARSHVTVVLTGEGADEVFAGYSNYQKRLKELKLCSRLGSKYSPLPYMYSFLPTALRKDRILKASSRPASRRYTTISSVVDVELHKSALSPALYRAQDSSLENIAEQHYFTCNSDAYLDRMLHIDKKLWLADDLLTKVDRATMAYSLEARVPYLDHMLVEFAARLPTGFKIHQGTRKYLMRRLATSYLPQTIINRPKQGFSIPFHEWMHGDLKPLMDDVFSEGGILKRNIFRKGIIERWRREDRNHTRLWALLTLELWFRRYAPDYRCG